MSNAPKFEDIRNQIIQLGADKARGADSKIKYGMLILEAAYLGSLSLEADKHGKGRRDGVVLAEAYVNGRSGAAIFDRKSDAGRALVADMDKFIKMGSCPKWGTGEPLSTVNELMSFWQQEQKAGKKLNDAYNVLKLYCTQQLKRDRIITGAELHDFVYAHGSDPKTAEEVLDHIRKIATKLKNGKVANCPDIDTSDEVHSIIKACGKRLGDIAKAKGAVNTP